MTDWHDYLLIALIVAAAIAFVLWDRARERKRVAEWFEREKTR